MNHPRYARIERRGGSVGPAPGSPAEFPAGRRSAKGCMAAAILLAGAFVVAGCAADPIEEVDVDDVQDGQASVQPEGETVSLSGRVDEYRSPSRR